MTRGRVEESEKAAAQRVRFVLFLSLFLSLSRPFSSVVRASSFKALD